MKSTAQIRCLADVQSVPIAWLWPERLALGKVNIIAGQPGLGKSQITIALAAAVTTGGAWPDGTRASLGSVIFISCEDDAADTIGPRLDAAGADRAQVHIIDWIDDEGPDGERRRRTFDLGRDIEVLRNVAEQIGNARLIVIDPISAYLGGADSHKTSDVRAALAPLQTLAAEIAACVVMISHLNKGSTDPAAMSRVSGSGAFVAAARSAWFVAQSPRDETRRILTPLKNNIGDDKTGFAYVIEGVDLGNGIQASRVVFDATLIEISAEEALASASENAGEASALADAENFLRAELADGPRDAKSLKVSAMAAGLAWRTIERAKKRLGVQAEKSKTAHGGWMWVLSSDANESIEDRQVRQHRHSPVAEEDGGVQKSGEYRQRLPSEIIGGVGGLGENLNGHAADGNGDRSTVQASPLPIGRR